MKNVLKNGDEILILQKNVEFEEMLNSLLLGFELFSGKNLYKIEKKDDNELCVRIYLKKNLGEVAGGINFDFFADYLRFDFYAYNRFKVFKREYSYDSVFYSCIYSTRYFQNFKDFVQEYIIEAFNRGEVERL